MSDEVYVIEYMVMKAKVDAYIEEQRFDGNDLDETEDGNL